MSAGPRPYKVVYRLDGYKHRTVKSFPTLEAAIKAARYMVSDWQGKGYFWKCYRAEVWYMCPPQKWHRTRYPFRCYNPERPCTPNTPRLIITFITKEIVMVKLEPVKNADGEPS